MRDDHLLRAPWLGCFSFHYFLLLLLSRFSRVRSHRQQPTRLPHPWDSPGKNTGVGCHFLLQCMKVKSENEVAQSCPTPSNPMYCSLPGSSIHGIFQARVLEWGAIAFSDYFLCRYQMQVCKLLQLCSTLCNPMDYSLLGSSVHGILQARILEWVAMPSSRGSSWPRDGIRILMSPALAGKFFATSTTWSRYQVLSSNSNFQKIECDWLGGLVAHPLAKEGQGTWLTIRHNQYMYNWGEVISCMNMRGYVLNQRNKLAQMQVSATQRALTAFPTVT